MITSLEQLDLDKKYTYEDYMTWRFEERVELFKGKVHKIAKPYILGEIISSVVLPGLQVPLTEVFEKI